MARLLALFIFHMFMGLDSISGHKHAKKELGQYPAILTSNLVKNPYIFIAIQKTVNARNTSMECCYQLCCKQQANMVGEKLTANSKGNIIGDFESFFETVF